MFAGFAMPPLGLNRLTFGERMRRGPAPKPTHLKVLAGNPGRRKLNQAEPQPRLARRLLSPVKLDDYGRAFWDYYSQLLKRIRVLSEADLHALASGAQWWSVYQRAMSGLHDGLTQVTDANGEIAKPQVTIARQAFQQCWAVMSTFGLNPGDRGKLRALPTSED